MSLKFDMPGARGLAVFDQNGPTVFDQNGPVVFDQNGPAMFDQNGPAVFDQNGMGAGGAGRGKFKVSSPSECDQTAFFSPFVLHWSSPKSGDLWYK